MTRPRNTEESLRSLARADLRAIQNRTGRVAPFLFPQFTAVFLYRLSRRLRLCGRTWTSRLLAVGNQFLTGAEIDPSAVIGPGFQLVHTAGVIVGPTSRAGRDLVVFGGVLIGASFRMGIGDGFPQIGDNCTLYAKCSVLGPIRVGDGSKIAAHALVLKDVPSGATARGVPAIVVGTDNS